MRADTRIETGRSWRDLPPSPPEVPHVVEERPTLVAEAPAAGPSRATRWVIGALALASGLALGLWAPWTVTPEDTSEAAALPERIVPPPPSTFPGEQEPGTGGGSGGLEVPRIPFDGLVTVEDPPEGYSIFDSAIRLTPDGLRQLTTLTGPEGDVTIEATLSAGAGDPGEGEPVDVRGTRGRLLEQEDRIRLTWTEQGLITVTIDAPSAVGEQWVLDLAESLTVGP